MGRLRDGVSLDEARGGLRAFWPAVLEATTNPGMPADRRAMYLSRRAELESGRNGYSRVRNRFARPLWLLFLLVVLLLIVACASAANLLLARASARQREFAVRIALGAGRRRVVRQLMTETLVWTTLGALLGVLLATWAAGALVALMTTSEEAIVLEVTPTPRILLFAGTLALVIAALCAALPAFRITRLDSGPSLKASPAAGAGRLRGWSLNSGLVIAQVALAIVLVSGAGLFVRSLQRVLAQDAGFERDSILVVATDPLFAGYQGARLETYYEQLLERLQAIPGVESASLSMYPPISNDMGAWTQSIGIGGAPAALSEGRFVHFTAVSPGYFRTVGMSLLDGRDFSQADGASSARVVIVNESLAQTYFGRENPLGRRITIGRAEARRDLTIVGIVRDAKYQRLQEPTRRIAYLAHRQLAEPGRANLFAQARASGSLATVGASVRREVRALDPTIPVRLETVADRIRESVVTERVLALLASALGLTAVALSCASLFGLLSYAVTRRTREIGVRIALGADRGTVLAMVLRDSLVIASIGTVVGVGASLAVGRVAGTLLFQVEPSDPVSHTVASALMLTVGLAASAIPARRAARIDPVRALRHE
jgi:predicted permease